MNDDTAKKSDSIEYHKKANGQTERGPSFSVPLPDGFPISNHGGMRQAAPTRSELVKCSQTFPRVAGAYECAVGHLLRSCNLLEEAAQQIIELQDQIIDLQDRKFVLVSNLVCFSSYPEKTAIAFSSKEEAYSYAAKLIRAHDPYVAKTHEYRGPEDDRQLVAAWLNYQNPHTILDVFEVVKPVEVASTGQGDSDGEQ